MSGFKFNFDLPNTGAGPASSTTSHDSDQSQTDNKSKVRTKFHFIDAAPYIGVPSSKEVEFDCLEIGATDKNLVQKQADNSNTPTSPSHEDPLWKVRSVRQPADADAAAGDEEDIVKELEEKQTDLISGVYEGGLKVWECAVDLVQYLCRNRDYQKETDAMTVLELGCGHGLPGCYVLREQLRRNVTVSVLFADFNAFVLRDITINNILRNTRGLQAPKLVIQQVALGAGDWLEMSRLLVEGSSLPPCLPESGRFDLILSAETMYTEASARDTAYLMAQHLVPQTGLGLVATKRYYFGVGGGSDAFCEAIRNTNPEIGGRLYELNAEAAHVIDTGTGNIRELFKVVLHPK